MKKSTVKTKAKRGRKAPLPGDRASQPISIRIPVKLLNDAKFIAGKKKMAYQTLLKLYVYERVVKELPKYR